MLTHTFVLLRGISPRQERTLWKQGITTWKAFQTTPRIPGISERRKRAYDLQLAYFQSQLDRADIRIFQRLLPTRYHYRLSAHCRPIYLDIETYGARRDQQISIICLADSEHTMLLNAQHTSRETLLSLLANYDAIVTYNGSAYDLPRIEHHYQIRLDHARIDLRHLLARLGHRGGLKRIETHYGIQRDQYLRAGDPLLLWRHYQASHDDHYLEILSDYIRADTESLIQLHEHALHEYKQTLIGCQDAS